MSSFQGIGIEVFTVYRGVLISDQNRVASIILGSLQYNSYLGVYYSRDLLVKVHYFVHLNLSITLCLGYIVFISAGETAVEIKVMIVLFFKIILLKKERKKIKKKI